MARENIETGDMWDADRRPKPFKPRDIPLSTVKGARVGDRVFFTVPGKSGRESVSGEVSALYRRFLLNPLLTRLFGEKMIEINDVGPAAASKIKNFTVITGVEVAIRAAERELRDPLRYTD